MFYFLWCAWTSVLFSVQSIYLYYAVYPVKFALKCSVSVWCNNVTKLVYMYFLAMNVEFERKKVSKCALTFVLLLQLVCCTLAAILDGNRYTLPSTYIQEISNSRAVCISQ